MCYSIEEIYIFEVIKTCLAIYCILFLNAAVSADLHCVRDCWVFDQERMKYWLLTFRAAKQTKIRTSYFSTPSLLLVLQDFNFACF